MEIIRLMVRKEDGRKIIFTKGEEIESLGIEVHGIENAIVEKIEVYFPNKTSHHFDKISIRYENLDVIHTISVEYDDYEIIRAENSKGLSIASRKKSDTGIKYNTNNVDIEQFRDTVLPVSGVNDYE